MSVGFQDYFRVRMAEEMGAFGFKLTADFPEIVDFPIEGNSQRAMRVVHGCPPPARSIMESLR